MVGRRRKNRIVETGVSATLAAAHRDVRTGALHGHTWEVVVWFPVGADARDLLHRLAGALVGLDHTELPAELASGEALAAEIMKRLPGCNSVEVNRPSERIFARIRT